MFTGFVYTNFVFVFKKKFFINLTFFFNSVVFIPLLPGGSFLQVSMHQCFGLMLVFIIHTKIYV